MSLNLRVLPITGGRLTLYIDYWPPIIMQGKKRRKEYLGIYVLAKPRTARERDENNKLYQLAELRLSERRVEIAKTGGIFQPEASMSVSSYCRSIGKSKKAKKTQGCWSDMALNLEGSGIGNILLSELTVSDCNRFRNYLTSSNKAASTQNKYFGLFKTVLRQAHLAYLIPVDLHDRLDSIARGTATKEFLRQSELDLLFATPVRSQLTRKAFLFSCLTGMRHSDIKALRWTQVHDVTDGVCELRYTMQKTGKHHILPIGKQAREVLGKRGKPEELSLPNTPTIQSVNYTLHLWTKRAGISKSISFHCGRHTFATLALAAGTPLKVVSDYLGHSSITQTEVYARLLEDQRNQYVGMVNLTVPVESPPILMFVK